MLAFRKLAIVLPLFLFAHEVIFVYSSQSSSSSLLSPNAHSSGLGDFNDDFDKRNDDDVVGEARLLTTDVSPIKDTFDFLTNPKTAQFFILQSIRGAIVSALGGVALNLLFWDYSDTEPDEHANLIQQVNFLTRPQTALNQMGLQFTHATVISVAFMVLTTLFWRGEELEDGVAEEEEELRYIKGRNRNRNRNAMGDMGKNRNTSNTMCNVCTTMENAGNMTDMNDTMGNMGNNMDNNMGNMGNMGNSSNNSGNKRIGTPPWADYEFDWHAGLRRMLCPNCILRTMLLSFFRTAALIFYYSMVPSLRDRSEDETRRRVRRSARKLLKTLPNAKMFSQSQRRNADLLMPRVAKAIDRMSKMQDNAVTQAPFLKAN